MPGISFTIPNVLATQPAGNLSASKLDDNWSAIKTALSGLVAALTDLPLARDYTGFQAWADAGNIPSGATLTLGDGNAATVTGTTTIGAISTKQAGALIVLTFAGALTLTHSANLILQGAVDALTAAGDVYVFKSSGGGVYREVSRRATTNADPAHFVAGDGVLRVPSAIGLFTTQTQPVRAANTAYQPSTTLPALVTFIVDSDATHSIQFQVLSDAANPPTTVVVNRVGSGGVDETDAVSIMVPASSYYKVTVAAGNTLVTTTEVK